MAQFIGPPPSENYMAGRASHSMQFDGAADPSYVVIHTMVGTIASAGARFMNPASNVSAHYGIGLDGSSVQWVQESDTAYHAGNWDMNLNSVGIEHEDGGDFNGARSDALYQASSGLVRDICNRYGIPIDRAYILMHKEVPGASTGCPDALDIERIVAMAAGTWHPPAAAGPAPPATYPLSDQPPAGTTIEVTIQGAIMAGANWFSGPGGANLGAATQGDNVGIFQAVYDGANWWDRISAPGTPTAGDRWLQDSIVDTSDAQHPAATNPTPAAFWNDQNDPAAPKALPPAATTTTTTTTTPTTTTTTTTTPTAVTPTDTTPAAAAPIATTLAVTTPAVAPPAVAPPAVTTPAVTTPEAAAPTATTPAPPADLFGEMAAAILGDAKRGEEIYKAVRSVAGEVAGVLPSLAVLTAADPTPAPPVTETPPPDPTATVPPPEPTLTGSGFPPLPPLPPTPGATTSQSPAGAAPVDVWGGSEAAIFSLQIFYLTILAVLALLYFTDRGAIELPEMLGPLPVAVPWFGALGAVLISLVGVTEHRGDWDPTYRFWHWARPLLGTAFGVVSVLIIQAGILAVGSTPSATTQNVPRNLLYYLAAFVLGYREETFRELIKRITDIIFSPGKDGAAPTVSSLLPQSGPSGGGTLLTVLGTNLVNTNSVTFGTVPAKFHVDGDGQVTVTTPSGTAGTTTAVTIVTKDGSVAAGTFTYQSGA